MSEKRKVGELLKLSLQLGDGATQTASVRVFVELRNQAKVLLEPRFEIFDSSDGDYVENTRIMPDLDCISATYFITDTGGTNLTTLFSPQVAKEQYLKDVVGQTIEDNLDAKVSSIVPADLSGEFNADEPVEGSTEESILEASLESDTILEGETTDEC